MFPARRTRFSVEQYPQPFKQCCRYMYWRRYGDRFMYYLVCQYCIGCERMLGSIVQHRQPHALRSEKGEAYMSSKCGNERYVYRVYIVSGHIWHESGWGGGIDTHM